MPPALYSLVAILSVFLCGVPLAACIAASGERRVVFLFLHSFVAGILVIALACQACWTAGFSVHSAAPWLVASAVLANIAAVPTWVRWRSQGISWSHTQGLAAFVFVALMANAVYAVNGGKPYYGRAWGDHLNYSMLAHYLRVGPPPAEAPHLRPALAAVRDGGLLDDRIGQSFLHAWVAELTRGPELEAFHATTVLAMLATTAVAWLAGVAIGCTASVAGIVAVAVALAPPTQSIILESFLSQAVGTPFVVYAVVITSLLLSSGSIVWLGLLIATTTWVCIAYFEFLPPLIGVVLVLLVASRVLNRQHRGSYLVPCVSLAVGVTAGLLFNTRILRLITRIGGLPGFGVFFPFAYSAEGLTRLIAGDSATQLGHAWNVAAATGVLGLTAAGMAGFVFAARRRHATAWPLLALTLAPWPIRFLPGDHSYQFYKVLQSFWPYVWIGLAALTAEVSFRWGGMATTKRALMTAIGCVMCAATVTTAIESFHMVTVEATGESPRSGVNSYLRTYGTRELRTLFHERHEPNLVVSLPDRRAYLDRVYNGTAALQLDGRFVRMQSKWLMINDRIHQQPHQTAIPDDASTPDLRSLDPTFSANVRDLLVLQIGSSYLRPDPSLFEEVASRRRIHVFHPVGSEWLLARTILPQPLTMTDGRDDHIVAGNHPTQYVRLDLESASERPKGFGITVRYRRLSGARLPFWHVYSDQSYGAVTRAIETDTGDDAVVIPSGPIRAGVTQIYFGPRNDANASTVEPTDDTVTITSIVYGGPPPTD